MYYVYRSINDLNKDIVDNLYKFPHDIDLVVGIPRSGMLPANLLALYLNKPYTDIDSFVAGRVYSSGERRKDIEPQPFRNVLIVDDSISQGTALRKAKEKLEGIKDKYQLTYAAIIATTEGAKKVDIYCEIIDDNRFFQWNMFHSNLIMNISCFDIDGVLCLDPPEDDDGPKYTSYISHATPYIIPTVKIDTLVSCRLEKYRDITEKWLKDNDVNYNRLVMLPFKTKAERVAWGRHGEYKGKVYRKSKDVLFVESSLKQAVEIARISGKQVFCTENMEMVDPDKHYRQKERLVTKIKQLAINVLGKLGVDYHVFKRA